MFIVNVEGAIFKNGNWLLIKRSKKEEHAGETLSLVGGKVEKVGDSIEILERTLEREIFEEVGITVKDLEYVNSTSFVTDTGLHVVDVVFLCEHELGEAFAKSPDEVDGVIWMSTEQILSHPEIPDYLKRNLGIAQEALSKRV